MRELVVHQVLSRTVNTRGREEVVSGSTRLTYEQLWSRVRRLARSLADLGVRKGAVIGVLEVNTHRNLELHFASSMLGAVLHTINFRLPGQALVYTMQHAEDEWVFVSSLFLEQVEPLLDKFPNWVVMDREIPERLADKPNVHCYEDLIDRGRDEECEQAGRVSEDDFYSILYTTGTTGRPKGIRYRHRDVVLGSLQLFHHLALHETGAAINSADTVMPLIPFFHIHGWGTAIFAPYLGAKLVLPGRAGPEEQGGLIREEGVSWANLVPTQLHMLLEHRGLANLKVLTGGSPLPSGLAGRADKAGISYGLIYGGSDQLGTAISVVPEDVAPGTPEAGEWLRKGMRPVPMVDVVVADLHGNRLPQDGESIGEVWVSSPWLPEGYFKNEEKTREAFSGGWFRTGDIGVIYDNGLLYVMDRESDAIKSGGEWIPSGVLEAHISEHPAVDIASVISRPDEKWGERPKAVVKASAEIGSEDLREFLLNKVEQGALARFWVPDEFSFVEDIPVTSAGKIDKVRLREQFKD
jgi:fatty-acyl-CoA synthase